MVRKRPAILAAGVLALAGVGGCGPGPEKIVTNQDPSGKIPAIKQAARLQDRSAIAQLIKDLSSSDPAVRFYAIQGLERLTGQTLGYRYFDEESERLQAIERWRQWLQLTQAPPSTQPERA